MTLKSHILDIFPLVRPYISVPWGGDGGEISCGREMAKEAWNMGWFIMISVVTFHLGNRESLISLWWYSKVLVLSPHSHPVPPISRASLCRIGQAVSSQEEQGRNHFRILYNSKTLGRVAIC